MVGPPHLPEKSTTIRVVQDSGTRLMMSSHTNGVSSPKTDETL